MPRYDLSDAELLGYRSSVVTPADLDEFWDGTLADARSVSSKPTLERVDSLLLAVETFDVNFSGFGGEAIRGWLHRPAGVRGALPVVVSYVGYSCGRGLPHQTGLWPLAGYVNLVVDNRGQGSAGGYAGDTPDSAGAGPASPGFVTRGVEHRETYYYRRLFTDAVLAVDAARELPGVDPDRVAVAGVSQGGGIALAVSGLADGLTAVMADVPFLSDFPRGAEVAAAGPYLEITGYLGTHRGREGQTFDVLAYFDAAVLAQAAAAPALFSVGLMDRVSPPSTVYAAYNAYAGPKELVRYPFNDHEGGQFHHEAEQLRWLARTMSHH